MATDLHGDPFGHAGPNHVPNCRAPEVVEQFSIQASRAACRRPRLADVPHRPTVAVENAGGDLLTVFGFEGPSRTAPGNDLAHFRQLAVATPQRHATALAVLRVFWPQLDHLRIDAELNDWLKQNGCVHLIKLSEKLKQLAKMAGDAKHEVAAFPHGQTGTSPDAAREISRNILDELSKGRAVGEKA